MFCFLPSLIFLPPSTNLFLNPTVDTKMFLQRAKKLFSFSAKCVDFSDSLGFSVSILGLGFWSTSRFVLLVHFPGWAVELNSMTNSLDWAGSTESLGFSSHGWVCTCKALQCQSQNQFYIIIK